ncbi:MAG: ROK family protein [Saprospiraceae bacterium]|nr:ROK family protein [Saprospiraceae bacterium]
MAKEELLWGIDMGGTKIEAVIVRKNPFEILVRERIATEQEGGYSHVLSRFQELIQILQKQSGLRAQRIGIGTPGIIDSSTQLIKNSNTQCIIGKSMQADLEKLLGIEVKMANDANCFAMAEATIGVVPDHLKNPEVVFGVILGTGVGGGLVVNGQVVNGLHGIAGEWGHNHLVEDGLPCYCGHRGCVETVLSGPATEKYYESISAQKKSMREINQLLTDGDSFAVQTMDRYLSYFGKAVAVLINILDPEAIVFGGGLGNLELIYQKGPGEVLKHLFNKELNTLFLRPKLGDSAGVIGAALL